MGTLVSRGRVSALAVQGLQKLPLPPLLLLLLLLFDSGKD